MKTRLIAVKIIRKGPNKICREERAVFNFVRGSNLSHDNLDSPFGSQLIHQFCSIYLKNVLLALNHVFISTLKLLLRSPFIFM